jgi:hypothetical protein
MSLTLGDKIDCVNPIRWTHRLNRGLVGDYSYIPGLSNETPGAGTGSTLGNVNGGICYDLTRLPGGAYGGFPLNVPGIHGVLSGFNSYVRGINRPGGFGKTLFGAQVICGGLNNSAGMGSPGAFGCRYVFSKVVPFSGFAWIRTTTVSIGTLSQAIWGNDNSSTKPGWSFSLVGDGVSNASLRVRLSSDGTTGRIVSTPLVLGQGIFSKDVWYYVGFTYDGTDTAAGIALYSNGVPLSLQIDSNVAITGDFDSDDAGIGWPGGSGGSPWTGYLDAMRLYDRWLAPSEVRELYLETVNGSPGIYNRVTALVIAPPPPPTIAAATGSFVLTGVAATMRATRLMPAGTGSYVLTGKAAQLKPYKLRADMGVYLLTGKDAQLKIASPARIMASVAPYVLTGKAAALLWKHRLDATVRATYVWTGIAASLKKGHPLIAATQTYVVSGIAASLRISGRISPPVAPYVVTGIAAGLYKGFRVIAASRSYTETGVAAGLYRGKTLITAAGSYIETGIAANLLQTHKIAATVTPYTETGNDADLLYNRNLAAGTGSFTYTANAAALDYGRAVLAATGVYTVGTPDAGLIATRRMPAVTASYTETGIDALLTKTYTPLLASPASFVLTGIGTGLRRLGILSTISSSYVLTGYGAGLLVGRGLTASTRAYAWTGVNAGLIAPRLLVTSGGTYVLTGYNVGLAVGGKHGHMLRGRIALHSRLLGSIRQRPRLLGSTSLRPRLQGLIGLNRSKSGGNS